MTRDSPTPPSSRRSRSWPGLLVAVAGRFALAVAALSALACDTSVSDPGPPVFRIGVLAHMEPDLAAVSGIPTLEAAEMAAAEINDAGGVPVGSSSYRVEIVAREHRLRLEDVTTAARALINLDTVHALVGPQASHQAIPVGAVANRSGIPMISPMSSNPATTAGRPYVFRMAFLDADQADVLARFARTRLDADLVGVLVNQTSPYATEVATRFGERFRELGGRIVEVAYPGGGPEIWRQALREVLAADPDRVFLPLQQPEMVELMTYIEAEGIEVDLLGSDSWDVLTMEKYPAAQGAYLSHQWTWTVPDSQASPFVARYQARYGSPPRSTAALTYDAIQLLARAATAAGTLDGAALRDALVGLPAHRGVSGIIDFDGSNSPRRDVVISRIDGGRARYVATVEAR